MLRLSRKHFNLHNAQRTTRNYRVTDFCAAFLPGQRQLHGRCLYPKGPRSITLTKFVAFLRSVFSMSVLKPFPTQYTSQRPTCSAHVRGRYPSRFKHSWQPPQSAASVLRRSWLTTSLGHWTY